MYILINDIVQYSTAPTELKSPALADTIEFSAKTFTLDKTYTIDCVGIGNTTAEYVLINGQRVDLDSGSSQNGLYMLTTPITTDTITVDFGAIKTVGRLALGKAHSLGLAPSREPAYWSTATSRVTLSGQVIDGVGGVSGREINVDVRYKFTREIMTDIETAYPTQLSRMYPLFLNFKDCSGASNYPWVRFYGYTDTRWLFQSSVNMFLYSKKLKFTEAY